MEGASFSIQGSGKPDNQDSHLVDAGAGLLIVADGVTHCDGGGVASTNAVRQFTEALSGDDPPDRHRMRTAISRAHALLRRDKRALYTTFDATIVQEDRILSVHVGDGRIYHLGPDGLERTTEDHVERGYLANALGAAQLRAVVRSTPRSSDVFGVAIASDGLWNEISEPELETLLLDPEQSLSDRMRALQALLAERSNFDDATLAIGMF
ncbi:MAG: hypothetical protein CMJ83_04165 [Planctomycetes bacterium]|nr:hypothetical protein [Planctomycetota bacterium]